MTTARQALERWGEERLAALDRGVYPSTPMARELDTPSERAGRTIGVNLPPRTSELSARIEEEFTHWRSIGGSIRSVVYACELLYVHKISRRDLRKLAKLSAEEIRSLEGVAEQMVAGLLDKPRRRA